MVGNNDSCKERIMRFPSLTYEEQMAEGGVRRKWFDVPRDSLPPVFYLPLYAPLSADVAEETFESIKIRVARYERVPKGTYPDKMGQWDVYEYKGDEFL